MNSMSHIKTKKNVITSSKYEKMFAYLVVFVVCLCFLLGGGG